ncbi:MBL fold metallo-hydrolase [Miltoncostaea marina]|uniref:MBL fold metallo-hydrolase n=1 Tax=Miltoncostaea marina TaxID=2843215 RepID=UPI001C3D0F84|nr:MBL fold metallo-hydrolase [Miltoncostaea marina]
MDLRPDVADGVHLVTDAYVNWFLVEGRDGRVTVVDAGHPRSWASLLQALPAVGRRLDDVEAIVLTHGHFDHVGFAERARRELGVPVWAPAGDLRLAARPWSYRHERARTRYAVRHPGFVGRFAAMGAAGALTVTGVREARPYEAGPLAVPGDPVALATPGHTDGHHALHLPDRDAVIAGDAVVTFDPYTGFEGPRIVAGAATADSGRALRSLDALAATGARRVLTGHGDPWDGGAEAAAERARGAGAS